MLQLFGVHPSFYKFISHIRNEQTMTSARIEQLEAGAAPKRVAARYRNTGKALRRVAQN
jgi:hypothetical protein